MEYDRRASDKILDKLDQMIEQEEDLKSRGHLMLLHLIAQEVISSRQMISNHSKILSWKSAATIIIVLQAPLSYVYINIQDLRERVTVVEKTLESHVERFGLLPDKLTK